MSRENTQRNSTGQAADGNLQLNALVYAARGWPVFPCKPHSKEPLTPRGFKDATTDLARIEEWWWQYPGANIGIPTGVVFDVVDFDDLTTLQMAAPGTRVLTGRGVHWYVRATGYRSHVIRPGLDFKGRGGYVIVPPSWHEYGTRYVWQSEDELVNAPDWVKPKEKRIFQYDRPEGVNERGKKALRTWYYELANMPEGNRNGFLHWAACKASETGFTQQEVLQVLTEAALAAGLPPREIDRTIRSGFGTW